LSPQLVPVSEDVRLAMVDSRELQSYISTLRICGLTLGRNTECKVIIAQDCNRFIPLGTFAADIQERVSGRPRFGRTPAFRDGKTAKRIVRGLVENG